MTLRLFYLQTPTFEEYTFWPCLNPLILSVFLIPLIPLISSLYLSYELRAYAVPPDDDDLEVIEDKQEMNG